MKVTPACFLSFFLLLLTTGLLAQEPAQGPERIRLFLDCDDCDFSYFRRNVGFVDFVRDQLAADVHILVTRQFTASQGRNYRLNFIGKGKFSDMNYQLEFHAPQSDTDALRRDRLVKRVSMGLMPYVAYTEEAQGVSIDYDGATTPAPVQPQDPWNFWVFRLSLGLGMDAQEQQNEVTMDGSFRVDRITDLWKLRTRLFVWYNEENFEDDGETIKGIRRFSEWENEVVHSLSPRWSVGAFTQVYSSLFRNTDLGLGFAPAIEYNIFPWDESDRKVFTIGYFAGVRHFDYIETTLFGEDAETRAYESLRLQLILRQPWGEIEASLEGFHYFHDLSKYRVTLDTDVSIRVTKGFSVYSEVGLESIHDQLYLPAGDTSIEDLLLRQRQLATTYEVRLEMGFRYTFGSIYNNVVNPRL